MHAGDSTRSSTKVYTIMRFVDHIMYCTKTCTWLASSINRWVVPANRSRRRWAMSGLVKKRRTCSTVTSQVNSLPSRHSGSRRPCIKHNTTCRHCLLSHSPGTRQHPVKAAHPLLQRTCPLWNAISSSASRLLLPPTCAVPTFVCRYTQPATPELRQRPRIPRTTWFCHHQ